jgi:hypothetical protein
MGTLEHSLMNAEEALKLTKLIQAEKERQDNILREEYTSNLKTHILPVILAEAVEAAAQAGKNHATVEIDRRGSEDPREHTLRTETGLYYLVTGELDKLGYVSSLQLGSERDALENRIDITSVVVGWGMTKEQIDSISRRERNW